MVLSKREYKNEVNKVLTENNFDDLDDIFNYLNREHHWFRKDNSLEILDFARIVDFNESNVEEYVDPDSINLQNGFKKSIKQMAFYSMYADVASDFNN